MQAIVLKMDSELLNELQQCAINEHKSLSAWLNDILTSLAKDGTNAETQKFTALKLMEQGVRLGGKSFKREDLYD